MVAVEMGAYLEQDAGGQNAIRGMIEDDIRAAKANRDAARALALKVVLHHFICEHPACERRSHEAPHSLERRTP